jgi:type VI secretion system Hcp family effector
MEIDGIDGPYEVAGVGEKLFSIDSYSHGLYQPVSEGGGHSRLIGTANVSEFIITKKVDASSALLMQALCENKHIPEIKVYDCATESDSTEPTPVVTVTFTDATIASLTYSGANNAEATQVLGIRFDTCEWEISNLDRVSGTVEAPQMYKWEAKAAGVRS